MIDDPNLESLSRLVHLLGPLTDDFVFIGGCAVGLLISDPAAPPIRETYDVDAVVDAASLTEYYQVQNSLRELGFSEDVGSGIICRWKFDDMTFDIMPGKPDILGFGNRWYEELLHHHQRQTLPDGRQFNLVSPPYFIITKLIAFENRGGGDYLASHDLEDLLAVIDGPPEIVREVRDAESGLKEALSSKITALLNDRRFLDALPGHVADTTDSPSRLAILEQRLRDLGNSPEIHI